MTLKMEMTLSSFLYVFTTKLFGRIRFGLFFFYLKFSITALQAAGALAQPQFVPTVISVKLETQAEQCCLFQWLI